MPTTARQRRRFQTTRKLRARIRQPLPAPLRTLITDTIAACDGEDETLCIHTAERMRNLLTERNNVAADATVADLPAALKTPGNFVFIQYLYKVKYKSTHILQTHSFALVNEERQIYRIDSWEGIHPLTARKIHFRRWYKQFIMFLNYLEAGYIRKELLEQLFGTWDAEKSVLEEAGEYVSNYPSTAIKNISGIRLKITVFSQAA
jgi:peptidoglycan hydrolase-like protein with peptidoglycan-binding domain